MFNFLRNIFLKQNERPTIEVKYFVKYKNAINKEIITQLLEKYKSGDIIFEPIREKLTEKEQEDLYAEIDKSDLLSSEEKIETIISLMSILDGIFPEPNMIFSLEKVFGKEFMEAIEKKRDEFKTDIAIKKLVKFVKSKNWRAKKLIKK
jgi:hypothetical protein